MSNPFRRKLERATAQLARVSPPTAHDAAMAEAFPLGAGFGHGSARARAARLEASLTRASRVVELTKDVRYLTAQAEAFDAGAINAQGRRLTPAGQARSAARQQSDDQRQARRAAAQARCAGQPRWAVPASTWADAAGYFGGPGRALVLADHDDAVGQALAESQPVPADVADERAQRLASR